MNEPRVSKGGDRVAFPDELAEDRQAGPQTESTGSGPATVTLRSLAPEHVEDQHGPYVRHLEDAVKDPRNKNIALTGRYGVGPPRQ